MLSCWCQDSKSKHYQKNLRVGAGSFVLGRAGQVALWVGGFPNRFGRTVRESVRVGVRPATGRWDTNKRPCWCQDSKSKHHQKNFRVGAGSCVLGCDGQGARCVGGFLNRFVRTDSGSRVCWLCDLRMGGEMLKFPSDGDRACKLKHTL